jgi:hypothetical protein
MTGPTGRSARVALTLPDVEISAPIGEFLVPYSGENGACRAVEPDPDRQTPTPAPRVSCRVEGRTDPANIIELGGRPVEVGADGSFATELDLRRNGNTTGLLVRHPQGTTRIVTLQVDVTDRDAEGDVIVVVEAIPAMTIHLPPEGAVLTAERLALHGSVEPGSEVRINDTPLEVDPDGQFSGDVELPPGPSRIVAEVRDANGRSGRIERQVEVARTRLFLMAFADAVVNQLDGDGALQPAGIDEGDDTVTDGRLAFYLKGRIAGRYLITAGYDSDRDQIASVFGDVDAEDTQLLLNNLDPDKLYPVYGDDSTVVFDVQSREQLYLALESDEIGVLIGNFPLAMTFTELAAYQRTLYGGRFVYRSSSETHYGDPNTEAVLFAADVGQQHVRDEIRATGGSLYYLSQRRVIQGSEEVTLVVRDENTGLQLSRLRQRQNVDYTIKYPEGRLMFHRPVLSVLPTDAIVDPGVLPGH